MLMVVFKMRENVNMTYPHRLICVGNDEMQFLKVQERRLQTLFVAPLFLSAVYGNVINLKALIYN